jgi:hypothetical protein
VLGLLGFLLIAVTLGRMVVPYYFRLVSLRSEILLATSLIMSLALLRSPGSGSCRSSGRSPASFWSRSIIGTLRRHDGVPLKS